MKTIFFQLHSHTAFVVCCCLFVQAVHWCIDELKRTVPIWKKEIYSDGSMWKENEEWKQQRIKQQQKHLREETHSHQHDREEHERTCEKAKHQCACSRGEIVPASSS